MSDIKRFPFSEPIAIYLHSCTKLRVKALCWKEPAAPATALGLPCGSNAKAQIPNAKSSSKP